MTEGDTDSLCEISLFCVPRPFEGHVGVIQRNAVRSWRELGASCEILLLGAETGIGAAAAAVDGVHLPNLPLDRNGFPRVDEAFRIAERAARSPWLCYVNGDIILLPQFLEAARRAISRVGDALIVSRRWNLDITRPIDFDAGWDVRVRHEVRDNGTLFTEFGIDVFLFPKGFFTEVPPFAIGGFSWDNWLVHEARAMQRPVVDVTEAGAVVHQKHDYDDGAPVEAARRSTRALRNFWLAGDSLHGLASVTDATHVLRGDEIAPVGTRTVSVVVLHLGSLDRLRECLRACTYQSYPRTYLEVVVVDQPERAPAAPILSEFPFVTLAHETIAGRAAARNKGAAVSAGDVLVFIDSDWRGAGDWVERACATAERHGFECVVASNPTVRVPPHGSAGVKHHAAGGFRRRDAYGPCLPASAASGLLVPIGIWRRVGQFDEEFRDPACADWDWSARAAAAGVPLVHAPDAVVVRAVDRTWRELAATMHRAVRRDIRLARLQRDDRFLTARGRRAVYTRMCADDLKAALRDQELLFNVRLAVCGAAIASWLLRLSESRKYIDEPRAQVRRHRSVETGG
jgi:GT2 family glycosyltransferase